MKLATYRHDGATYVGVFDADNASVSPLLDRNGHAISNMLDIVSGRMPLHETQWGEQSLPLRQVEQLAPLPRPGRNVMCVGKNYHAHAREFTASGFDSSASNPTDAIPEVPIIFTKAPESVIGNGHRIRYPSGVSEQLDYEAELAVVIGIGGLGIAKGDALKHVFGYTIINDVTARDLQARHKQWFLGKSLDTFCPMGPVLVTQDEWTDEGASIRCWVNDDLRQEAAISDLIFDIPTLVATISAGMTLYPGDIIATGTPAGVGIGFKPPRFLKRGDTVRIEISGIGTLQNQVA